MAKKKLAQFAENLTFPFFFQLTYDELTAKRFTYKGSWKKDFFKNSNPLVLEIGCGKGEYTTGLAKMEPNKNYIGIDIKGARMWRGAKTVQEEALPNVAFIRSQAGLLTEWFDKDEVDEIWFTFPDPQPGARENKRLTSPRYLQIFSNFISPNGCFHLKTDSTTLYNYTLDVVSENNHSLLCNYDNVYAQVPNGPLAEIQTFYEKMWLKEGKLIRYVSFRLNPSVYER